MALKYISREFDYKILFMSSYYDDYIFSGTLFLFHNIPLYSFSGIRLRSPHDCFLYLYSSGLNVFDYLANICLEKVYVITYHEQFKGNKGEK